MKTSFLLVCAVGAACALSSCDYGYPYSYGTPSYYTSPYSRPLYSSSPYYGSSLYGYSSPYYGTSYYGASDRRPFDNSYRDGYGPVNWTLVDNVERLPLKVADIYRRLTG